MQSSPITDSAELRIPRDLLTSTQLNAVSSTAAKDANGLKWSIECYRRPALEPNAADLFVFDLRVSHMPVKCAIKYTIANISGTTDVICSTMIKPKILSIGRDVLVQKIGDDDGLTFQCELTFTHIPKTTGIPGQLDLSKHHHFTDTVMLSVQLDIQNPNQTTRRPIDKDGRFVWSMLGHEKEKRKISLWMRTTAAHCQVKMIYEYAGSNFFEVLQGAIQAPATTQNRYHAKLTLPADISPIETVVIKCTAWFTFEEPIHPYIKPEEQPVAAESDSVPPKPAPTPLNALSPAAMGIPPLMALQGQNTKCTIINDVKSPGSITMLLPFSSKSAIRSDPQSSPEGITWSLEVPPFKKGKQIRVCLRVSRTPICADVMYNVPLANLTHRIKFMIEESESPKVIFTTPNNGQTKVTCNVQFPKLTDDGSVERNSQSRNDALLMMPSLPMRVQTKFTVSLNLTAESARYRSSYVLKSNVQTGPENLRWWIQIEPEMDSEKKMLLVSWHVSKKPVSASISYSESGIIIEGARDVVVGTHDPVPKLLYKIDRDDFIKRRSTLRSGKLKFRVEFYEQTDSADRELPKVLDTAAKSVDKTKDDSHNGVHTSADGLPDDVSFQSEQPEQPSSADSDDTSEYTSSEDGDDSPSEEDGMTDQQRLAYRLRRQNEETLAVQKLLAKTKNVPMIADGSTF